MLLRSFILLLTGVTLCSFTPASVQDLWPDPIHDDQSTAMADSLGTLALMDSDEYPGYEFYEDVWDNYKLNPYGTSISQIPDSMVIDLTGFIPPVTTYVTSNYGMRRRGFHRGIDLKVQVGQPVVSAFDGMIRVIRYERRGYGHFVVVRHNNGLETLYGHLSRVNVELNQQVKAGQVIGLGGNTGRSTGPHLHFETRFMGNPFNPNTLIDFKDFVAQDEMLVLNTSTKRRTPSKFEASVSILTDPIRKVSEPISSAGKSYIVRKGDSLGKISDKTGVSISKLCKINKLSKKSIIRPGQKLKLT